MLPENHKPGSRSIFSVITGLILLLFLPVSAIWLLGSAIIDQSTANQRAASEQALARRAESISEHLDPEIFFAAHFNRLYDELYDGRAIDAKRLGQLVASYSARQLGFFPAVFVNEKLITPVELLGGQEKALVDAWEVAHDISRKSYDTSTRSLRPLFGAAYSRELLHRHEGRVMTFSGFKGVGYIFYKKSPEHRNIRQEGSRDGVFIVVWSLPRIEDLKNFLPAELTAGIRMAIQEQAAVSQEPGRNFQFVRKRIGERFLLVWKEFDGLDPHFARTLLKVFLLFLVMIMSMLAKYSSLLRGLRTLSIRMKLVGLILYAVALPLSGLLYFGWKYVAERRELLLQDAYIACHSSMNDFENSFEKEKASMLKLFRSFRTLPGMQTDPGSLFEKFRALDAERIINWVEVRDIEASVLMTTQRKETAQEIGLIGKAIARLGINNFLGHRLAGKALTINAQEVLVQEFLEGPFGGWARIFESPDELHQVSFGGFEIFWYWDVFADPAAKPAFIVVDQNVRWAVRNYLTENIKGRISLGGGAIRLLAWSTVYSEFLPEDTPSAHELMNFTRQVMRSNSPQSSIIRWNNADWVAAGAPGKKLVDNVLLSLYPLEEVEREIAGIRSDLTWGVLFALVLALLVGSLFSHTIIRPVANLITGVQALKRRDTSCHLEIMQNDELGRLSATFNATRETLADLLSAKAIQAQLIPEKAPEMPGYAADLVYVPTADLGGDYCDIISLGNGRWLLVIGDVTGHGVSSAIVTTMVKAVVSDYAMNSSLSLHDMLVCINELLFSQFKRKKCMTLFAALLDADTGMLSCVNAGHPLPMHFSAAIRQPFPQLNHPPLGFSIRSQKFPEAAVRMAPGDSLVLFTDILIETPDESGKPYGSAGLARLCEQYQHLPPDKMRAQLLQALRHRHDTELADDLTLIIIKRNLSSEETT
ncbi:MAG: hypothetical protein CVV41_16735 [Candidatus Riflebacteria bacterium HGW-Riflebacteria-1]|jgi:serine phosphatase RsbU (regulator of sigma subunit)|nr:MAG: hypothetical protein CVV41_16735 [Candidatus Riflebacteria bacterium HGW-Riflebacteria-1]